MAISDHTLKRESLFLNTELRENTATEESTCVARTHPCSGVKDGHVPKSLWPGDSMGHITYLSETAIINNLGFAKVQYIPLW